MRLGIILIGIIIILLLAFSTAEGLQLLAANPAHTSPGQSIQILGAGFSATTRVKLGTQQLAPTLLDSGQLKLLIPPLAEGEYVLQLIDEGQSSAQILNLRVELLAPRIENVSPSNINECATIADRLVTIHGQNFKAGLHLLLNGAAVPADRLNEQQLSFTAPALNAGIYGLQVVNRDGKSSSMAQTSMP